MPGSGPSWGYTADMSDVTRILSAIQAGDRQAAADLLPLVYDELRGLATARLAAEPSGQTLQPTALVHEVYLRLVANRGGVPSWDGRGHFFAAAAEAMRRILIDAARRKRTHKAGGGRRRMDLPDDLPAAVPDDDLLVVDEALVELERHDPQAAQFVKLRYYAGLSHQDAAAALGLSRRAADRVWALARAWLFRQISKT